MQARDNDEQECPAALAFHPLPAPTRADVTNVARRTAARVARVLRAHPGSVEPDGQMGAPI